MVYGRVFGWIVSKINELLTHKLDTNIELSEIGKYLKGLVQVAYLLVLYFAPKLAVLINDMKKIQ